MLVEREVLLADLLGFAADGLSGHGRIVFLGGEAGVGKTSLTRALAAELADRCAVRVGAVDNLTTADPLAAFADALPEWTVAVGDDRLRLFRSLREQLRIGATLLVLEDLHWADEATLDALRFLGRRLDGVPVLIVATYRHDEVSVRHPLTVVMGEFAGLPEVHRRLVPPLTAAGVGLLVEEAGLVLDPRSLHERTGGNSFFVTEVLATAGGAVPTTIRDAVLARMARLSGPAAEVAAAAAILGTAAQVDLLVGVSGRRFADVDECVEKGALVPGSDGLAFRHELAREAVEGSLSVAQRRRLHKRALDVLSTVDPTDHRTLAHHALGAGEDARAVRHATAAAERARRLGAHREAVAQYHLALSALSAQPGEVDRAQLFEALAYECYLTNQLPEAISARHRALDLFELQGNAARTGGSQRWLSRLSWVLGRNEDAERYGAQAVATLEPLGESHELAMAYSNLSQLRMLANDTDRASQWGGRALSLARRLGDREVEIHALNNIGSALCFSGSTLEGEALLRRSLDLALADDAHEHVARAYTNLGSVAAAEHRYLEALKPLSDGIAYCKDRDLDSWTRYMQAWQVETCAELGRWNEALALCARLLAYPDLTPITVIPAAAAVSRIEARRGLDASDHLASPAASRQAPGNSSASLPRPAQRQRAAGSPDAPGTSPPSPSPCGSWWRPTTTRGCSANCCGGVHWPTLCWPTLCWPTCRAAAWPNPSP